MMSSWMSVSHMYLCGWVLLLWLCGFTPAHAEDRRMALLVVNQQGWKQDPYLQYAVRGDLHPLATELKRLGFQVQTLINQPPQALRKKMKQLQQRLEQTPKIQTFLFYYSGHADRKQLHMGAQVRGAYTHAEFLQAFRTLQVKRKFAIFDACFSGEIIRLFGSQERYQQLLQAGRIKGVGYRIPIDISRLKTPNQGYEEGFRIITSSLEMSWELNQYRASVFTYHLLQGLRGPADLDHDGKISVDELFDYTSRAVKEVTGQKPQQLVVAHRARPYALAPAYRSRLTIGPNIVGNLYVAVANFVWSHHKTQRKPLTLSVVDGPGVVQLQQKQQCWRQAVRLPKGGELQLGQHWQSFPCRKVAALRSKGVVLPAQVESFAPSSTSRSLGFWIGVNQQGFDNLRTIQPSVGLEFRWHWLQTALGFAHGFFSDKTFSLSRLTLQTAAGWPLALSSIHSDLFLGAFAQGGLIFQHLSEGKGYLHFTGSFGAFLSFTWWNSYGGLRLNTWIGVDYTPVLGDTGLSLFWQIGVGWVWGV